MRGPISIDFEIGRGRSLYGRELPFYGRNVHFSPMREKIIASRNSFDTLRMDADVHFIDAGVCFKKKIFKLEIAVELQSDGQKQLPLYSVTAYHASVKWTFVSISENTDEIQNQIRLDFTCHCFQENHTEMFKYLCSPIDALPISLLWFLYEQIRSSASLFTLNKQEAPQISENGIKHFLVSFVENKSDEKVCIFH